MVCQKWSQSPNSMFFCRPLLLKNYFHCISWQSQLLEDREKLRKEKEEFNEKIQAIERLGGGTSHLMNGSN